MSNCSKHPMRSRKNCSECFSSIGEQTSREMLANLDKMEKEEESLVIKAPRQKKIKIIEESKEEIVEELEEIPPLESLKLEIDKVLEEGIKKFKSKINDLCDIRYEHLAVPLASFTMNKMDLLERDGFKLINFYTGDIAKVSGFKEDVAYLNRYKSNNWKKTIEEWKSK